MPLVGVYLVMGEQYEDQRRVFFALAVASRQAAWTKSKDAEAGNAC